MQSKTKYSSLLAGSDNLIFHIAHNSLEVNCIWTQSKMKQWLILLMIQWINSNYRVGWMPECSASATWQTLSSQSSKVFINTTEVSIVVCVLGWGWGNGSLHLYHKIKKHGMYVIENAMYNYLES